MRIQLWSLVVTQCSVLIFSTCLRQAPAKGESNRLEPWGMLAIHAPQAWQQWQQRRKIVVAVIDTGADISHPDLVDNIWVNPGETGLDRHGFNKATNHIDDDGNGYIDDVHGWNFATNGAFGKGNSDLTDHHGHGTHVAGIIGATGKHVKIIRGVVPNVSLMILKYYEPKKLGGNSMLSTIQAIDYAISMGAQIINYSAGGAQSSALEKQVIARAMARGILFVAAAGNEARNSDQFPYFPADYGLANIISVTAIDRNKHILSSSNFGVRTVDIAAPGENIISTLPGGRYGYMTGTSQATAFVTGAAAALMSQFPNLNEPSEIIQQLASSGRPQESLRGKTKYQTSLDIERALQIKSKGLLASQDATNRAQLISKLPY